jgi:hypothetical protein
VAQVGQIQATKLLLGRQELRKALGSQVRLQGSHERGAAMSIGTVVAAAAHDSAYRSYTGQITVEGTDRPIAVGTMALVFDTVAKAERTFSQVASAAHMRTRVGECSVAVETVTATSGLVSYWGFLRFRECMVILTLDTMDPQIISMTDFRSLTSAAAERIETVAL